MNRGLESQAGWRSSASGWAQGPASFGPEREPDCGARNLCARALPGLSGLQLSVVFGLEKELVSVRRGGRAFAHSAAPALARAPAPALHCAVSVCRCPQPRRRARAAVSRADDVTR
eukprot:356730-Chlamydomonas_euryale.AAC.1